MRGPCTLSCPLPLSLCAVVPSQPPASRETQPPLGCAAPHCSPAACVAVFSSLSHSDRGCWCDAMTDRSAPRCAVGVFAVGSLRFAAIGSSASLRVWRTQRPQRKEAKERERERKLQGTARTASDTETEGRTNTERRGRGRARRRERAGRRDGEAAQHSTARLSHGAASGSHTDRAPHRTATMDDQGWTHACDARCNRNHAHTSTSYSCLTLAVRFVWRCEPVQPPARRRIRRCALLSQPRPVHFFISRFFCLHPDRWIVQRKLERC